MICVRVPADLHAVLTPLLAARGLHVTGAEDSAAVIVSCFPARNARWLALAADMDAAIAALDSGADDVAMLSDAPPMLAARIARLARPDTIRVGGLAIDPVARIAIRDGRRLDLLPREYAVLLALARQADTIVTRLALRTAVWGREADPGTNVIEVHISRVRATLDRDAPAMLRTERGRGYRLVSTPMIAERHHAL